MEQIHSHSDLIPYISSTCSYSCDQHSVRPRCQLPSFQFQSSTILLHPEDVWRGPHPFPQVYMQDTVFKDMICQHFCQAKYLQDNGILIRCKKKSIAMRKQCVYKNYLLIYPSQCGQSTVNNEPSRITINTVRFAISSCNGRSPHWRLNEEIKQKQKINFLVINACIKYVSLYN